ncbi:MAG TPA: chaplin family protein [Thermobifida alba]|nr:chaplin family protein [Thermobifida alba]
MLKKTLAVAAVTAAATLSLTGTALAHSGDDVITSGKRSVLGGNQLVVDANVPVNVCGNAIAILGIAYADCWASGAGVID